MNPVTDTPPSPQAQRPLRSRIAVKILALFLSLCLVAALTEIVFRLFVSVTTVAFQYWDPLVGIRRMPNQHGRNIAGRTIDASYNFNAQGWNYPRDFSIVRPPNAVRLCLVGDSYVEAMQVDCERQMAVVLEQTFAQRLGKPVECYPFGCSGFGTAQEYQLIRHYVLDYKPDVVILFFAQNDVYDCSPYLGGIEPFCPTYYFDEAGQLVLMPSHPWERSGLRRMFRNLAVPRYFLIQQRLLDRFSGSRGPGGIVRRESAGQNNDRYFGATMTEEERGRMSWRLIEALLARAQADCDHAGTRFAVAFRGHLPVIKAAEKGEKYQSPPKDADPFCLDKRIHEMGQDFLEPMAAKLHIPYFDLTEVLVTKVRETGRSHNFPDDDHYNTMAHEAAGRAMATWAERLLATPAKQSGR